MRIFLVRHGQSTHNINQDADNPDPPLTALGEQQAELAARAVAEEVRAPVALYASPQRRALQTAAPLQRALGLPVRVLPDLCESGGLYQHTGMSRDDILREWPATLPDPSITEHGWWTPGETEAQEQTVYARAARVTAHLRTLHEGPQETIVVVTHGRFCGMFISTLLGLGPTGYTRFTMENCALTRIDFDTYHKVAAYPPPVPLETAVRLRYHNRISHLPPELVT
jgi:broad specificity phosphatase PhoE